MVHVADEPARNGTDESPSCTLNKPAAAHNTQVRDGSDDEASTKSCLLIFFDYLID